MGDPGAHESLDAPAVEVAFALRERQWVVRVPLDAGLTAIEAVRRSGILEQCPDVPRQEMTLGVFGSVVPHDRQLVTGDRVEIYRPLVHDPREARRRLAQQAARGSRQR